jgi:hypothetical protein
MSSSWHTVNIYIYKKKLTVYWLKPTKVPKASQFWSVRNSLFALTWLSRINVAQEPWSGHACIGLSTCEVPRPLCYKSGLRHVKSWQNVRRNMILCGGGVKNNTFTQYLLLFSSECFMFSFIQLTLFLLFCVGVKFGLSCQNKKSDWRLLRARWWW